MFFWRVSTFMDGLKKFLPELHDSLTKIAPKLDSEQSIDELWDFIEPESIDYGLMEKASNIYVVSGEFSWNDIGSWNAFQEPISCLLYTSPSPRDQRGSRMPSSA